MRAAIVLTAGTDPVYGDFPEPAAGDGEVVVGVSAAAISQVVRSRASGRHYSSAGQFPFVAGVDGVGRLADGRRVYFALPRAPYGSMAERAVVRAEQCVRLPDTIDDVAAAALANPGVSSWAALTGRARLEAGETVLVNGATGIAGRLAVRIARYLGAGKVIATGRNAAALAEAGADVTVPLIEERDALEAALRPIFAEGVDVVIDYLWGKSAEAVLIAAAKFGPDSRALRYVEVGSASGQEITLPSAVLRSSAITLTGSGIGSIAPAALVAMAGNLFRAAGPAGLATPTRSVLLADVGTAWNDDGSRARTVLTIG
jgi:NADPH:quinone reductase-like Zn-dependent oxidoreductase